MSGRRKYGKKNKSSERKNTSSNSYSKKKFRSDVRVVSTNVVKKDEKSTEKKHVAESTRQSRSSRKERDHNRGRSKSSENRNRNRQRRKSNLPRNLIPYVVKKLDIRTCYKCGKKINEMSTAIRHESKDEYFHFDCLVREMKSKLTLKSSQRFVYLGSNTFGIIEDVREDGKKKFKIKDKIQLTQPSKDA